MTSNARTLQVCLLGLGAALIGFNTTTCVTVEEPPCPKLEIPEQIGCNALCDCAEEDMVGRVFRFTQLEIDEPAEFAELLNSIWEPDILNNTLNVLFQVSAVTRTPDGIFETLSFHGGPGWRYPSEELSMPPEPGQPSESVIDEYCLLDGYEVDVDVQRYHGALCELKNTVNTTLLFHSGPAQDPLVCAPLVQPRNAIPITNLKIRFTMNEDCTGMINGFIEGCITQDDANKICMCIIGTGACPNPAESKFGQGQVSEDSMRGYLYPENPEDLNLKRYCSDGCGGGWTNFGSSVELFSLLPTCINEKDERGYRIQGFVSAVDVTDKFNPIASDDCTER